MKEITVAARIDSEDPKGSQQLPLLMDQSKEINMPLDKTMRAIKLGPGELPSISCDKSDL